MDILPPAKKRPVPPPPPVETGVAERFQKAHYARFKWQQWLLVGLGAFVILALSAIIWYTWALQPRDAASNQKIHVVVEEGDSSSAIIERLNEAGLIRSKLATWLYLQINANGAQLQTGGYLLSPKQPVHEIINHIASGESDEQLVTIPPGLTLKELRQSLKKYGYDDAAITDAYQAAYTSPLLKDKPAGVSLEGYIFPESFRVSVASPLSDLFERSFDELYGKLVADGLIEKFKARGLNTHQALTLASIVQKEVSNPADQKQVAQVFYKRLGTGMMLGSDVTFEYAADLLGVTPAIDIDSPYNTRRNVGLPPGPIANMNYSSLQAVADPAPGDFIYFVAGDDGKTHFSKTLQEHEANTAKFCHDLCNDY